MLRYFLHKYIVISFILLYAMFLFSCASTKEDATDLVDNEYVSSYVAVNFDFSFQYPKQWHIFEEEETVRISNTLELLTFPADVIEESMRENSFLATLSMSSLEEIVAMHNIFSTVLLEALVDNNDVGEGSDVREDSTDSSFVVSPMFATLASDYYEQLVDTQDTLSSFFNISLSDTLQFAYIKEYDTIMIRENSTNNITFFRKMNDNRGVVIYNIITYDDTVYQKVIDDSIQLVLSVSIISK